MLSPIVLTIGTHSSALPWPFERTSGAVEYLKKIFGGMEVVSSTTARNAASELVHASAMAQFEPPPIPEYTCRSGPAKAQ